MSKAFTNRDCGAAIFFCAGSLLQSIVGSKTVLYGPAGFFPRVLTIGTQKFIVQRGDLQLRFSKFVTE
jgi:hypothetical protein